MRNPVPRTTTGSLLLALGALAFAACDRRQPTEGGGAAALAWNLVAARSVEVHVDEPAAREPLARLAALERARTGADVRVLERSTGDRAAARIVVGSARSPGARALAQVAGVAVRTDPRPGFSVGDVAFDGPADLLCATFEDPDRPGLPLTVWLGNDLDALLASIEDLAPRAEPRLDCQRDGERALSGPLGVRGGLRLAEFERLGVLRMARRGPLAAPLRVEGFVFEVPEALDPASALSAVAAAGAARARALAWAAPAGPVPDVEVALLASVEDLLLAGERGALGRCNRALPAADMFVAGGVHDGGTAAARAVLRAALRPAVAPWLEEAASIDAADTWWGRDLDRWLAHLARAGRVLRVAECVDPRSDARVSPHVLGPSRAALARFLLEREGAAFVRELWSGSRALVAAPELESEFEAAWRARVAPYLSEVEQRGRARRQSLLDAGPRAGIVLGPAGPGELDGYGARAVHASIAAWSALGARGVAVPATFLDDARGSGPGTGAGDRFGPREGDAALFGLGLLAPHEHMGLTLHVRVLTSDAGGDTGSWTRGHEAEWQAVFASLARAVEHAGLAANLCGAEWLVLGSDLQAISGPEPWARPGAADEDAWRRDGWRRVIGAARGAFPGLITYAAADLEEAARVAFWKDLDAVGLELLPRIEGRTGIAPAQEARAAVTAALAGIAAIAADAGLPVILFPAGCAPRPSGLSATAAGREWTTSQLALLSESLRDAPCALQAAWLSRASTDPGDHGVNAADRLLDPATNAAAARAFFAGAAAWPTASSPRAR